MSYTCAEDRPFNSRASTLHDGADEFPENKETFMKFIILWLLGVPFGLLILLKIFGVF